MGVMNRTIIALVGMMGSGKGTCVTYLHETYGLPFVYFGGMVYDEVAKRGLDIVKDEKAVREDMRAKEGMAVMAKRAAIKADELFSAGEQVVVFDGMYSWSENKFLLEKYGDSVKVIALILPKKLRYERSVARQDSHRKYTLEQVVERDIAEIENIEKGGPIAFADYYLVNDGSHEKLLEQLRQVVTELGITPKTS